MKFEYFKTNKKFAIVCDEEFDDWQEIMCDELINPRLIDIVAVLESVKKEFEKWFGYDCVNAHSVLVFPCKNNPCCIPSHDIIFLSVRARDWREYIYQFAHELCHIMIRSGRYHWFEETLCQLASVSALHTLSEVWSIDPPYSNWREYSIALKKYGDTQLSTAYSLPSGVSIGKFFEEQYAKLCENPCWREVNTLCATSMLPIFRNNTNLWKDAVKTRSIDNDDSFASFLLSWKDLATNKEDIDQIIAIFNP